MRQVLIYELRYPGIRPSDLEPQAASDLMNLLTLMEHGVAEAAVSLHFFEAAMQSAARGRRSASERDWQADSTKRQAVEARLMAQVPVNPSAEGRWQAQQAVWDEASQEVRREAWREGEWPDSYQHAVPFLYAKSFLYAVDSVAQALALLTKEPWANDTIQTVAAEWETAFPTIRKVRNTSQHQEERILRRGPGGKAITTQAIDNPMIKAPEGSVTILNHLNGNHFGCTMVDGHFGEVEVSGETLIATGSLVQGTIDAFAWNGPGRYAPS